jgi:hypothetical protein
MRVRRKDQIVKVKTKRRRRKNVPRYDKEKRTLTHKG